MKSTRVTTFVDMLCGISLFLLAILMTNSLTRVTLRGTGSESSARPWACIEIILERRPPTFRQLRSLVRSYRPKPSFGCSQPGCFP